MENNNPQNNNHTNHLAYDLKNVINHLGNQKSSAHFMTELFRGVLITMARAPRDDLTSIKLNTVIMSLLSESKAGGVRLQSSGIPESRQPELENNTAPVPLFINILPAPLSHCQR